MTHLFQIVSLTVSRRVANPQGRKVGHECTDLLCTPQNLKVADGTGAKDTGCSKTSFRE